MTDTQHIDTRTYERVVRFVQVAHCDKTVMRGLISTLFRKNADPIDKRCLKAARECGLIEDIKDEADPRLVSPKLMEQLSARPRLKLEASKVLGAYWRTHQDEFQLLEVA